MNLYVLRLCKSGANGGEILSESVHDSFESALEAIPASSREHLDARACADIKHTLDDVGAWTICGRGDLSYMIHTRRADSPIARAREAAHVTQAELARRIGKPRSQVCDWEAGRRNPKLDALKKIADALGVPLDDLIK